MKSTNSIHKRKKIKSQIILLLFAFLFIYIAIDALPNNPVGAFLSLLPGIALFSAFCYTLKNKPTKNTNHINKQSNIVNTTPESISESTASFKYEHNPYPSFIYDDFTVSATKERWLSKYVYENVEIYRPDTSFNEIFKYDIVDVLPDPQNPYDSRAISISFHGNTIGYLNKGTLQDMVHDYLSRNDIVGAQIQKVTGDQIYIKIFFCKRRADLLTYHKPISMKLIGNGNEEMQDNISIADIGDKVEMYKDYETDRFYVDLVNNDLTIGCAPKSCRNILEELYMKHYEFYGEITDISENNTSGKLTVTVSIQPQ